MVWNYKQSTMFSKAMMLDNQDIKQKGLQFEFWKLLKKIENKQKHFFCNYFLNDAVKR